MIRWFLPILALTTTTAPRVGDLAPEFTATELGRATHRASLFGQITIVEFFATWCGPCRENLRDMRSLQEEFGHRIQTLVIATDDPTAVRRFLEENPQPKDSTWIVDGTGHLARRWGEDRLPTTFFVDKQAVIRHINRGHGPGFLARSARWLRSMLTP